MIILTGGAGFIGSCFLQKLNTEGLKDILVVDHLDDSEKWKNLVGKQYYDYMQKDDFLNAVVNKKMVRPQIIVHLGAHSSTTFTDANYYVKNNYEYSKIIAMWAFEFNIPFIYASSAATYGNGEYGYDDDILKMEKLLPLNIYAFTKHMFDLWILNNNYFSKVTGMKFFNVFGPNEYHKGSMKSIVCKSYDDICNEGVIRLFKSYNNNYQDGDQLRDFIYVKDVVEIMYFLFKNTSKTGMFNIGTGKSKTYNNIAKSIFSVVGKKKDIVYVEMPDFLRSKYQYFTQAKIDNLINAGYRKSFMSFEDSIKDYCYYLKDRSYL
ncbi:MAG: ADP-glyceromanno-heptose 6-epimerase [Endomicrobium sp.]|jgi:ADP-L-glycero-D-manno-heptose 6-epimerase|nr:ADP-glyceromanno-heptose 6-epimerase [Endomicrobium sp.]